MRFIHHFLFFTSFIHPHSVDVWCYHFVCMPKRFGPTHRWIIIADARWFSHIESTIKLKENSEARIASRRTCKIHYRNINQSECHFEFEVTTLMPKFDATTFGIVHHKHSVVHSNMRREARSSQPTRAWKHQSSNNCRAFCLSIRTQQNGWRVCLIDMQAKCNQHDLVANPHVSRVYITREWRRRNCSPHTSRNIHGVRRTSSWHRDRRSLIRFKFQHNWMRC